MEKRVCHLQCRLLQYSQKMFLVMWRRLMEKRVSASDVSGNVEVSEVKKEFVSFNVG